MSFDLDKEKMLCFMALNDSLNTRLSSTAASAFWRAFILEDRTTHEIYAKMRWSYKSGKKCWYALKPSQNGNKAQAMEELRCGLESVLKLGMTIYGIDAESVETAVECFYPPDDEGDPMRTALWLEQWGFVEVKIELLASEESGSA